MTKPQDPGIALAVALLDAIEWVSDHAPVCSVCCTPSVTVVDGECRECAAEMERHAKLTGEDY